MSTLDDELARLFRSAAAAPNDIPDAPPFGFETRVVAQWRAGRSARSGDLREIARLFRRLGAVAVVVIASASAAAYWQIQQDDELREPLVNAYAIVDNEIDAGVLQ